MTTIQTFYEQTLKSLSYSVEKDGLISIAPAGSNKKPATVGGKRLVLPTRERLKEGIDEAYQPFHPLAENIARAGASPVLEHMKALAKAMVTHTFLELAKRLLVVAADPSLHKNLPANCSDYLKHVAKADKKMVSTWEDLAREAVMRSDKNGVMTIYLRNGGRIDGKKVNRLCVITFPLITALEENTKEVYGVKLRKLDRETFISLLHYIMPLGNSPEEYSAGSNSNMAPFFDAFMRAYGKVTTQLNRVINRFAEPIDLPIKPFDLSYLEHMDNLNDFYGKIPSLHGNEGKGKVAGDDEEDTAETPPPSPKPHKVQNANYSGATVSSANPAQVKETGPVKQDSDRMSMEEWRRRRAPQTPQPNQYHAGPPIGYHHNPYQQQHQAVPPPNKRFSPRTSLPGQPQPQQSGGYYQQNTPVNEFTAVAQRARGEAPGGYPANGGYGSYTTPNDNYVQGSSYGGGGGYPGNQNQGGSGGPQGGYGGVL